MSEAIRVYFTGECDGFDALRSSLGENTEIGVVGASQDVGDATAALAGGHIDCVVHATRAGTFPAAEVSAIHSAWASSCSART